MSILKYGKSRRNCSDSSARCRTRFSLLIVGQIGLLLLLCFAANSASGQQSPTGDGYGEGIDGAQNSIPADCSDPMQAGSAQCSGQNPDQTNQISPSQMRSTPTNQSGAQTQNPNRNYSDTEQFSRRNSYGNEQQQILLRPEPLTEFQKFVASTTNQVLPIFGADLFRSVPSTFAPLEMTPVPSDYVIGPGDELRIRIWGQVNFQANLRVDRSGEIYLPQVGTVHVAGLPFSEMDAHLRSAIGRVYRNFDLTVDAGQIRSIQVYVTGEARRPGVYTVSSLSTLVDTLFASGGPSIHGSMRHIELRRAGKIAADFDLYDLLIRGDKSKDVTLQAGDVIFILPKGPEVAMTGSVRSPAIYELRGKDSLSDLIADAGGVSALAAEARISIERIEDHHARAAMEVAYDASGLATAMDDGDLVRVFSIVPMYEKTVILRGNTANPGRFAWHPGMRVSELIPDKDSLITRNYWWKRTQLGLPAPEFEPEQDLSSLRQPSGNNEFNLRTPTPGETNMLYPNGLQQNRYGLQQQNQNGLQQQNQYPQQELNGNQQDLYGTQQYLDQPQQDGSQQYGSQQNQYQSQQYRNLNAQRNAGRSSLAAEQSGLESRFPYVPKTEVRQIAPEIDWDYAVIERLNTTTLKTTLIPFDLGKLVMQHDASQDLELQPGDVVSIFSDSDIRIPIAHQTKMVTLGGEFAHAGVYTVQPGETFRQLVERAGGLSPNAYLYGSEYTRESTRKMQQDRIDEYVQSLDLEISRNNLAISASAVSSPQDLASGQAAESSERQLLASLRQIRATGRIVLKFVPGSTGTEALPDIALEDGDHFFVPSVPATVNVVGAVDNQNSFLFAHDQRAGMYLRLAGGANRDADRKREFIIRADGEVVSHNLGKGLWSDKFDNLPMYAGDTIVVPEKTYKPGGLRSFIEYSQLLSNFALSAAAISIIH